MRVLVRVALLVQEDLNEEKEKRNVKCWYKIEWDKLQFFFGTFSRIHTYWRTDKRSVILNCFWSSTSYAHTFSSEKMVLTYKDYKMACQTMANSKSSSWSFHLLDIIFISYSIQLQKEFNKEWMELKWYTFLFLLIQFVLFLYKPKKS